MKIKHNKGFTLAEVLITLVIIGVIAAITVPTLMQTTQKQEFATAFKKSYSVISQALYRIGGAYGYPGGDYEFLKDANFIDEFAKVTNVIKKCNTTVGCFQESGNINYMGLNNQEYHPTSGKSVITADGQMYTFASNGPVYGLSDEDSAKVLGRILVDVNGERKPNKIGIDFFYLYIVDGKGLVPAGNESTAQCNRNSHGAHCAAKVLREGKISY